MSSPRTENGPPTLSAGSIALLVAAVVACRWLATASCPVYDDAFITYRYARNLAGGLGLVFNPGEPWEPVLGTTTPLYALLLAGLAALGADLVRASFAVNVLCDVGTALLLVRALGRRPLPATVAVLAFAALPQLARISAGGMESPLFAFLALAAASAACAGRPGLGGLCAALVCVVRPEGVLMVAILAVARLRRPRELVRLLAPVAAVGLLSTALLLATYGDVVPQSVHAKSAMHAKEGLSVALARIAQILEQSYLPHPAYLPALPLVALGAWRAVRERGPLRALSLFALAITASYLAARPHVWGWYFYVPLTAWVAWLALGAEKVRELASARLAWRPPAALRAALPALAVAATVGAAAAVSRLRPTHVPERVYRPMHAWARETSRLHPRARILAADIGAIGYAWQGTVLDSEGLTWPQALYYVFPNAIIEALEPEYLLIVAEEPRLAHFRARPEIAGRYEPIARFSASGETDLAPELSRVSAVWVQDYLVYRRRDF